MSSLNLEDHKITLEEAVRMVTNYRTQLSSITQPDYRNALPFAEHFNKSVFETLIQQPGAAGVRAYLGLDDKKQVRLIFVATDTKGQDILPVGDEDGAIFEYGQRCPPICATGPLNPSI